MTEMNDKPAAYGTNILGGIIFLVLAICSVISYFNTEGSFVAYFSDLVRGLLGWGFYLAAPAFAISAYLLFTCGTKPVGSRVFATVMLPVLLSALSELLLDTGIRPGADIWEAINDLFELGKVMKSGGVIGGLITFGLNKALSIYGTLPILGLSFIYCFIVCFWGSLRNLVAKITEPRSSYVKVQPGRPAERAVTADANAGGGKKPPVKVIQTKPDLIDIPLGDEAEKLPIGQRVKKATYGRDRMLSFGRRRKSSPALMTARRVSNRPLPPRGRRERRPLRRRSSPKRRSGPYSRSSLPARRSRR